MHRWFSWFLLVIIVVGSATAYTLHKRQQRVDMEMGKRFPFTAQENGQLLTEEDGSPLRFRTRTDAQRYEQEYEHPVVTGKNVLP